VARASIVFVRLTRTAFTANPTPTTLDNVNGNFVLNDGATFLELTNSSGATRTVSVEIPEQVDQNLPVTSRTYTLSNGQVGKVGIYSRERYGGQLLVDVSGTGVTCVAYSIR
jgi:hypothetical protein